MTAARRALLVAGLAAAVAAVFARRWAYLAAHPGRLALWFRRKTRGF